MTITVIVPIYNAIEYLEKCLDSIVHQTYKNLEIILVDDGSTDGSEIVCEKYGRKDPRIQVVHKANGGLSSARKCGIDRAGGDYITFVDADDYIDLNAVEYIADQLKCSSPDILAYGLIEEYVDHEVTKKNRFEEGYYSEKDIKEQILPVMLSYGNFFDFGILPNLVCKYIKKTFLDRIFIQVSLDVVYGEDADMTYQLFSNIQSLYIMDYCPYHYCKRAGSMVWKGISTMAIENLRNDLYNCFENTGILEVMNEQLDDYIDFVTLLKQPKIKLDGLYPFNNLGTKIALYGAGGFGQAIFKEYSNSIIVWADKDYKKYQYMNMPVENIQNLVNRQEEYDVVYIAILNIEICQKVKMELFEQGVKKKVFYYKKR